IQGLKDKWDSFANFMNDINPFGEPLRTFSQDADDATASAEAFNEAYRRFLGGGAEGPPIKGRPPEMPTATNAEDYGAIPVIPEPPKANIVTNQIDQLLARFRAL